MACRAGGAASEIEKVARHVEISLNALIDRAQIQYAEYESRRLEGKTVPGLEGLISQAEQHLDELNNRLDSRRKELDQERHCTIGDITHLGRAMVLPHPERQTPQNCSDGPGRRGREACGQDRHRARGGPRVRRRERRVREPRV